ncbi:MAG: phosphoribosylglycinamide formyltransferase [Bacteroidota bacterium]
MNIAVFASGRGSNFESLYRTILKENISARIVVVISNNSQSGALSLARSFSIPALHISRRQFESDEAFNGKILETLRAYNVTLIVLAGYMKKVSAAIIREFRNRIINIHPALLPKFGGEGMYGIHVHKAVIQAKEKFSGATVHVVDEVYDHGKVLLQDILAVDDDETPESLAAKVLNIEHRILPEAVKLIADGKL